MFGIESTQEEARHPYECDSWSVDFLHQQWTPTFSDQQDEFAIQQFGIGGVNHTERRTDHHEHRQPRSLDRPSLRHVVFPVRVLAAIDHPIVRRQNFLSVDFVDVRFLEKFDECGRNVEEDGRHALLALLANGRRAEPLRLPDHATERSLGGTDTLGFRLQSVQPED